MQSFSMDGQMKLTETLMLSDEAIIASVMETDDDSDNDEDEREMEAEEPNPPSIKEMREAMRILKKGSPSTGI